MNNNFLPEDYQKPDNSNYMKLRDGENTFRVLDSAIIGWKYWTEKNQPVRSRTQFTSAPVDIKRDENGKFRFQHFWAFPIWNCDLKKVQILEITQSTIQDGIKALVDNKKWGSPKEYDITITRKGEGLETEYVVMPNPHSPIPQEAVNEFGSKNIDLEALYDAKDPFGGK